MAKNEYRLTYSAVIDSYNAGQRPVLPTLAKLVDSQLDETRAGVPPATAWVHHTQEAVQRADRNVITRITVVSLVDYACTAMSV